MARTVQRSLLSSAMTIRSFYSACHLTTHLLQPLDVVIFQPYKHYHAEAVDAATRTGCSDFNKVEFLAAIHSVRRQAFKRSTITLAFRQTGLIPYNPAIILDWLREAVPSQPPPIPSTPTRTSTQQSLISTPLTVRSLKRHAECLQAADLSPTLRRSFDTFIKGSLVQAHAGAQAQEDLQHTQEIGRAHV